MLRHVCPFKKAMCHSMPSVTARKVSQRAESNTVQCYESVAKLAKHAKHHLSKAVSEWSWQVTLASISSWVHGRQEAEVGVAGDPHQVPPLSNGHAARATLQQTGYPF